jgi:hypothetical protein
MSHDQNTPHGPDHHGDGRRSPGRLRLGTVLIGFLAIAGLLLVYEHRIHIITGNGVLIALLVLCVGMHVFMHSGHGGHSDGGKQ